jgi:hypothetical protein
LNSERRLMLERWPGTVPSSDPLPHGGNRHASKSNCRSPILGTDLPREPMASVPRSTKVPGSATANRAEDLAESSGTLLSSGGPD